MNVVVQPKALIETMYGRTIMEMVCKMPESRAQGVSVKMYNTSNVLVDETVTDATGHYQFMVCSGTYYIEFWYVPRIFKDDIEYA